MQPSRFPRPGHAHLPMPPEPMPPLSRELGADPARRGGFGEQFVVFLRKGGRAGPFGYHFALDHDDPGARP